jgi:hypothetical protein
VSGVADFLGNTVGEAGAFAAGRAVSPVLEPLLQALRNETWSKYPDAPLDALLTAQAVAEGKLSADVGADEAAFTGISPARFASLVTFLRNGPGVAEGLRLIREGRLELENLPTILERAGLEPEWQAAYLNLGNNSLGVVDLPLSAPAIALAIVRGNMTNPDVGGAPMLTVGPPTEAGLVPTDPVSPLDPLVEAAMSGIDPQRLAVIARSIGLPMSPQQAASAFFRGIIELADYYRAIAEGDLRNEWRDAILAQAREILTAHTYVEGYLREWIATFDELTAKTAQWGMSAEDTLLLYQTTGRPIPVHRITQGLARGGSYNGDTSQIPPEYLKSLAESNIRPEWYLLAFLSEQFTWPGYFVLKDLVPEPVSVEQATAILTWQGWEPTLAKDTAEYFAAGTAKPKTETAADLATQYEGGTLSADDYVAELEANGYSAAAAAAKKAAVDARPLVSARTAVLTKLRAGVVGGAITSGQAQAELAKTTITPATATALVAAWEHEREIEQITPASTALPAA